MEKMESVNTFHLTPQLIRPHLEMAASSVIQLHAVFFLSIAALSLSFSSFPSSLCGHGPLWHAWRQVQTGLLTHWSSGSGSVGFT